MADPPPQPNPENPPGSAIDLLASDQRRDHTVELLSAACSDGRLQLEDFTSRLETALAARRVGELNQLEADLGASPAPASLAARAAAMPTAWFVAIMSSTVRRGRWILRPSSHALAVMGEVVLDLRGAEVAGLYSHVTAIAVMGLVRVIVPEGINVDLDGLAVMGNKTFRGGDAPPLPGAPTVAITAIAVMGEVTVVTKGPRAPKLPGDQPPAPVNWLDHGQRGQYIGSPRHLNGGDDE